MFSLLSFSEGLFRRVVSFRLLTPFSMFWFVSRQFGGGALDERGKEARLGCRRSL